MLYRWAERKLKPAYGDRSNGLLERLIHALRHVLRHAVMHQTAHIPRSVFDALIHEELPHLTRRGRYLAAYRDRKVILETEDFVVLQTRLFTGKN